MTSLSFAPIQQFFSSAGAELSGGKLFFYAAGTTSKQNVYTDNTGATAFPNPIILNTRGEPTVSGASLGVWLTTGLGYKVVLSPSTDTDPPTNAIWTIDNVSSGSSGSGPAYVEDTGTTNALAVTLSPVPSSYTEGMTFYVEVANSTTGAVTINVNSLGAKNVTFNGNALTSGALTAGQVYLLVYDSVAFEVQNPLGPSNWVTNSYLATMPNNTIKGNISGSTAQPSDIAITSITGAFASGQYGFFAMTSLPTNWLLCDGSAVSRTTYSVLFGKIGTTYGAGDGSTTFNLPDWRGCFMRGNGTNGAHSAYASGSLGTFVLDQFQAFQVQSGVGQSSSNASPYGANSTGAPGSATGNMNQNAGAPSLQSTGAIVSDGTHGTPRTGSETIPFNMAIVIAIHV